MYLSRFRKLACIALALVGAACADARAVTPQKVRYNVHQDPNDAQSPVIWAIVLDLEPNEVNGNSVGWLVTSVKIAEFDANGQTKHVWIDAAPVVNSTDGLWWVGHADPNDPARSEFVEPPVLERTATAEDPADDDLDYSVDGVAYNAPPGGPPYEVTAALDYVFTLVGSPDPEAAQTDDPVDVPVEDVPPIG